MRALRFTPKTIRQAKECTEENKKSSAEIEEEQHRITQRLHVLEWHADVLRRPSDGKYGNR